MGFPRIISKSNKVYTKLGEFCLSPDGNTFAIVCYTCQEELQTQDQFWKHIQDEHNFMHVKDQKQNQGYVDGNDGMVALPLPVYRKMEEDQRTAGPENEHVPQQTHDDKGTNSKNYMDIKLEPHSIGGVVVSTSSPLHTSTANALVGLSSGTNANTGVNSGGSGHVEMSTATPSLYQLPQVPPSNAYAALVQQHVTPLPPALSMSAAAVAAGAMPPHVALSLSQDLPKDSNSTTASAGSAAVSSDDGERWYICDYETCGLKFKYQSRLELHRSVHSKERRFACDLCGASFKQSCNLSTHRKKKHFLKGSKSGNGNNNSNSTINVIAVNPPVVNANNNNSVPQLVQQRF